MSTSISNAFTKQYEGEVHDVFQRKGGYLRQTARKKTNVVGASTTFQKVGTGVATTKARHGVITPMNQDHTAIPCTLEDFYAGDWVDKLDEAKTNIDERMALAEGGAWALGRKVDDQMFTALDGTTQSAVTINVTTKANVRAKVSEWVEAIFDNDVPNDGNVWAAISPRLYTQLSQVDEFVNADFVTDHPMEEGIKMHGRWKNWLGVNWTAHTGVPGKGTASCKGFIWHQRALGYACAKSAGNVAENEGVSADITWHGDRAAHFVNHMMSGGACLIDDLGVIEGTWDDTAAVVTS